MKIFHFAITPQGHLGSPRDLAYFSQLDDARQAEEELAYQEATTQLDAVDCALGQVISLDGSSQACSSEKPVLAPPPGKVALLLPERLRKFLHVNTGRDRQESEETLRRWERGGRDSSAEPGFVTTVSQENRFGLKARLAFNLQDGGKHSGDPDETPPLLGSDGYLFAATSGEISKKTGRYQVQVKADGNARTLDITSIRSSCLSAKPGTQKYHIEVNPDNHLVSFGVQEFVPLWS